MRLDERLYELKLLKRDGLHHFQCLIELLPEHLAYF